MPKNTERPQCPEGEGALPACAPLAIAYVPLQCEDPRRYDKMEALSEGTLFPCLNLPFHLMVNGREIQPGPRTQLQALEFVLQELGLYLDTHPEDGEAFAVYQEYTSLLAQAKKIYQEQIGPLVQTDSALDGTYTWVSGPWPWNAADGKEC